MNAFFFSKIIFSFRYFVIYVNILSVALKSTNYVLKRNHFNNYNNWHFAFNIITTCITNTTILLHNIICININLLHSNLLKISYNWRKLRNITRKTKRKQSIVSSNVNIRNNNNNGNNSDNSNVSCEI